MTEEDREFARHCVVSTRELPPLPSWIDPGDTRGTEDIGPDDVWVAIY